MKITAIIGSARRGHTYGAAEQLLREMASRTAVEYELVVLSDYTIKPCFDRGEELCPLKDDTAGLAAKMEASDGIVFASPNYAFHVSGLMKVFIDRISYILHRPRFFGKWMTSIVPQGVYGGKAILKYFNFIGGGLGFNTVNGVILTTREPIPEQTAAKNRKRIEQLAGRFLKRASRKPYPVPSLFRLMMFRMSRSAMKNELEPGCRDYDWYEEKGWFESSYFYPVRLGPVKKVFGKLFDWIVERG